jgi:DNA-binding response OmpR family regulator
LVNQLLDLSKLEAGQMRLQVSRIDLVPFLKNLVFSFESLAHQKGIALNFKSEIESLEVYFEREKMEKVFYNLLANAFKFTDEGSVNVEISVGRQSEAIVSIVDTGIGIPPDRIPFVFDRFYSVQDERRQTAGTGIGLALSRELVEVHGGKIGVESVVGQGSRFEVTLRQGHTHFSDEQIRSEPLRGPTDGLLVPDLWEEPGNSVQAEVDDVVDAERKVVLVIEDNADVRAYTTNQLDAYRVLQAEEGAQGLVIAQETIPDLIITDLMMPAMDGLELAHAIRQDDRTSHVPIIMLTARAGEEDRLRGLETGVDAYLVKPFSARELRTRVAKLIEQRRLLREQFRTATVIKPSEVAATDVDEIFLKRVLDQIEASMGDAQFSATALADEVGMSASQLNRKLNALLDQTAGRLIRSMRLQRAADLISQNAGSLSEIAYATGFSSQSHFSTAFKKQFGVAPSEYESAARRADVGGRKSEV